MTINDLPYVIAVDFDGTLCTEEFPSIGAPNLDAIKKLIDYRRNRGIKVILWTCRSGVYLKNAIDWCKSFGLEFDAVNENLPELIEFWGEESRKISANEYWDDKAVRITPGRTTPDLTNKKVRKSIESHSNDMHIADDGTTMHGPKFLTDTYNQILEEEEQLSNNSKFHIDEKVKLGTYDDIYSDFKLAKAPRHECRDLATKLKGKEAYVIGVQMLDDGSGNMIKVYTVTPSDPKFEGELYGLREHSLRKVGQIYNG